jgi:gliding motility-associated-like protein
MEKRIKKYLVILSFISSCAFSQEFADPCFTSVEEPMTPFESSGDIVNLINSYFIRPHADIVEWQGGEWIGQSTHAYLELPPPQFQETGCRAIFIGARGWTWKGEGFALRLTEPLKKGEEYSLPFVYVSHGNDSDGDFSPFIYTGKTPTVKDSYPLGQMPSVGSEWTRDTVRFVANWQQDGDTWVVIHTGEDGTSGMFMSGCPICTECKLELGADIEICEGDEVELDVGPPELQYLWQDDSKEHNITIDQEGEYWVKTTSTFCGEQSDTINVIALDCEVILEIPNVFTPNGDDSNDTFVPIITKNIIEMRTIIYNRWGQQIYQTENLIIDWNGITDQQRLATDGVYYWYVEYTDMFDIKGTKKGYVLLVR